MEVRKETTGEGARDPSQRFWKGIRLHPKLLESWEGC